jgi:pyridoxine kinase
VIGDVGRGVFVRPGIAEFMAERAVAAADIVTPNHFELEHLTGRPVTSLGDALAAADSLRARGPRIVLVTSLRREEAAADRIEMLAVAEEGAYLAGSPLLPIAPNGAGDAVAALFLGHYLRSRSAERALAAANAGIRAVLEETLRRGARELQLVAAQEALVSPPAGETVRRVR